MVYHNNKFKGATISLSVINLLFITKRYKYTEVLPPYKTHSVCYSSLSSDQKLSLPKQKVPKILAKLTRNNTKWSDLLEALYYIFG